MVDYKNIVCAYNRWIKYHDDMHNEEVKILDFPYIKKFGDFRMFNGIKLSQMDDLIGEIRALMVKLKNMHVAETREIELSKKM